MKRRCFLQKPAFTLKRSFQTTASNQRLDSSGIDTKPTALCCSVKIFVFNRPTHVNTLSLFLHDCLTILAVKTSTDKLSPLFITVNSFIRAITIIVIVISKLLKRSSKAKRTRAPAYSRALRRIKGVSKWGSREAQVRFPEYQKGTE